MIQYTEIPLERELTGAETDAARAEILRTRFARLHSSGGFDLIVHILRCAEADALTTIYAAAMGSTPNEEQLKTAAARLWVVNYIREELSRASDVGVNIFDAEVEEDFLNFGPLADAEEHEAARRNTDDSEV